MNIGMNFQKPTLDNPEGLQRLDLRWALFIADPIESWNTTLGLWPEVKALCPRCEPVVRLYRPDVMGKSPEVRAKQFCDMLTAQFGDQPVDAIPFNEPDQAIEHGGTHHSFDGDRLIYWSDPEGLAAIASWASRYADAHRAIRPQDPIHLPACSAGMPVADWYEAMHTGGAMQKYDVLDVHLYASWQLSRLWDTQARGNTFVSEVGVQNGTPEQIAVLLKSLGHADFAWWKWTEPQRESNPEGDPAGYAIADRPDVIDVFVNQKSAPESSAVIYEDELKEWPKEDKSMTQQDYLNIVSDIWATAKELRARSVAARYRKDLAERIQKQCEILDDLTVEGGSTPAPFLGG